MRLIDAIFTLLLATLIAITLLTSLCIILAYRFTTYLINCEFSLTLKTPYLWIEPPKDKSPWD